MNYIDALKAFFEEHPKTTIGAGFGVGCGLGFALLGIWETIVLVIFAALGFYVGAQLDAGNTVSEMLSRFNLDRFKRK